MGAHRKTEQLAIRYSAEELRDARKAARLQTRRLKRRVTATELLRVGGVRLVQEILTAPAAIEPEPQPVGQ